MYFERGYGCRVWDVDGHEYIDYLMAFGSQLLGYAHPAVDDAVAQRSKRGQLLSMNHRDHVEFIEALLPLFPGAEMGVFLKTGSEATSAAVRIARRSTGRKRIARCGYHGWHDWCLPREDFVPSGLDAQVPEFVARDPSTLQAVFQDCPDQIAAVILAPEMVTPYEPSVFHELLRITHLHGALFIMDEVKTGIRIAPNSIAERAGIVPDMITVSKALANGWPLAATLGRREVMQAAAGMHYSATFHGDTTAMAAAHATLAVVHAECVQFRLEQLGRVLIQGLNAQAKEFGIPAEAYGEPLPAMPFFRFTHHDPAFNLFLSQFFFRQVLAHGIFLHPRHMWFLSHAHREEDIERTLDVTGKVLKHIAQELMR